MAIITEDSYCALCETEIDICCPFFASSGVPLNPFDLPEKYFDAPIHWDCLFNWSEVDKFLDTLFEAKCHSFKYNDRWTILAQNDAYFVAYNQSVCVYIAKTGLSFDVSIDQWPDELYTKFNTSLNVPCIPADRQVLAKKVIEEIIQKIPRPKAKIPHKSPSSLYKLPSPPSNEKSRVEEFPKIWLYVFIIYNTIFLFRFYNEIASFLNENISSLIDLVLCFVKFC
jgi:hypothetical protein